MPEVRFSVRWPDGTTELCYSPSLVIKDYLTVGESYTVPDFLDRVSKALSIASDRVKAKYGYPCSLAMSQLTRIKDACGRYAGRPDANIHVNGFVD